MALKRVLCCIILKLSWVLGDHFKMQSCQITALTVKRNYESEHESKSKEDWLGQDTVMFFCPLEPGEHEMSGV